MYTYIFELTGERQDGTEFYKTVEYSSYCSKIGEPLQNILIDGYKTKNDTGI